MRAWVYRADRIDGSGTHIFLEEVPVPRPGPGDLLLKVRKVSVCGTDEMLFRGGLKRVADGVVPGHEVSGEVVAAGPGVGGFDLGQMVAVESHYQIPGATEEGIIGLWPPRPVPDDFAMYGGGYAEYIRIPASCAQPLPESLAMGTFWPSLFEPAGNDYLLAQEVVERAKARAVGVFGCGPHGLYAQIFLRHFGVEKIYGFEMDPARARFARQLGCVLEVFDPRDPDLTAKVADRTGGDLFDATVDMVGKSGAAFSMCCDFTRPLGTVVLFGLFNGDCRIEGRAANDLIFGREKLSIHHGSKRLSLMGVTGREGIWPDLIREVASKPSLQELLMKPVTRVGPLDALGKHIRNQSREVLKAALEPFSPAA